MKLESHRSEEAIVKVVGPAFFAFLFINARISAGDSNIGLKVASIVSEFEALTEESCSMTKEGSVARREVGGEGERRVVLKK